MRDHLRVDVLSAIFETHRIVAIKKIDVGNAWYYIPSSMAWV